MTTKAWFDSKAFRDEYHCEASLGALYSPEGTVFRLWAPTAERVDLRLFHDGLGGEPFSVIPLSRGGRGLWSAEIRGDLHGVFYDYLVTAEGATRRTADPWARACAVNGERSMAVDLRRTDPPGWEADRAPELGPETVIYEVHVKDFSWDPASGVRPEWRGKYLALTQESTTLDGNGVHPTGLDYLKSLGVTHVQLMPVFDYGSVDEAGAPEAFNWGYDPVNYNVPEGSYSTDPRDGISRIRELKAAVLALHKSGLRVVMDVVYNHTYTPDSWLQRTVPGYFYRENQDGTPSNGSGCGNDTASERSMCGKYILDSVLYWAEEYHMDGFRFDLMGLLDAGLINAVRDGLDRRWGPGEKLLLGEPWRAGDTACAPGTVLADKAHIFDLHPTVAAFNDTVRDAVKGNLWQAGSRGMVNGGGLRREALLVCLRGQAGFAGDAPMLPSQVVNYASCHDDHTLWDKLALAAGLDPAKPSDALLRQNKFAAAIYLTCQGALFFLSGEEFGRTKRGVKNSYRSSLAVNRLDWRRSAEYGSLVDNYRGLIALRKLLPGLCDKSPAARSRIRPWGEEAEDLAAFTVDNSGGRWPRLLLIYNARTVPAAVPLPEGSWEVLFSPEEPFGFQHPAAVSGTAPVGPVSALILGSGGFHELSL